MTFFAICPQKISILFKTFNKFNAFMLIIDVCDVERNLNFLIVKIEGIMVELPCIYNLLRKGNDH